MAMPFLNYTENPLNLEKFKKNPKNSNLNSFWAFLFSIFIYISVFYVFNLSPSTLLCTTKFWFIISNTLILIIAADFGGFSSSKGHDFFYESGKNNVRSANIFPSLEIQYLRIDEKTMPKYRREIDEEPQEKIIGTVAADHIQETLETKPKVFITHEKKIHDEAKKLNEKIERKNHEVENGVRKVLKKREARIATAAAKRKEGKKALQRTLSERHEEPRLEENEFSRMSDEELNRRVEEFIRRCNRQIRLQAASNGRQE